MRRKALIVLLALGTIGGYASGFASLRGRSCQRREAFEQHVAQVCVDAARKDEAANVRQQPPPAYNGVPVIVQINPAAPASNVVTPVPAASPAPIPQ